MIFFNFEGEMQNVLYREGNVIFTLIFIYK